MKLPSQTFLTRLEGPLRAAIALESLGQQLWRLSLTLNYDGKPAGSLSFNLSGYTEEEAVELAKNARTSQFIMQAVDEHLWGEMD